MIKSFVDGKWINGIERELKLLTGKVSIHYADTATVDLAISSAKRAFKSNEWRTMPKRDLMVTIRDKIQSNFSHFAKLESSYGKPITQAKWDVEAAIQVFDYYSKLDLNDERVNNAIIKCFPIGVVGLITSFNYPLLLTSWKLAPALLAGNTVILKPSEKTPLADLFLADLLKSELPSGVFNVLLGDGAVGQSITRNNDIGMVSFTGSSHVGQSIALDCAKRLIPYTLELGGKNAAIVFDGDIEKITDDIINGAFSNMGQNCCGISRLFVKRDMYQSVLDVLIAKARNLVIGDPVNENTYIGPLIDSNAFNNVSSFLDGRQLLGQAINENIVTPTIFTDISDSDPIAQTEIFGPVLAVLAPFDEVDKVIDRVNNSQYGLASGIFTQDKDIIDYCAEKIDAGIIWVNCYNDIPPYVPFGGFKNSGIGKELGYQAVRSYCKQKSIVFQ
ncbi:hypothetical protein HDV06_002061 [Boothiomyces sp. JEL0866]|nr:hypothetical protein HDV06_002061 [Boothiomyces sp. JEL0866]